MSTDLHRVMIVDDNSFDLFYLDRVFQHRKYKVQACSDPVLTPQFKCKACPCALEASGCPDVIVSDFIMPGVSGVELLESIVAKGCRCRHLALISGKELMEAESRRIDNHRARFFAKPLDLDDFYGWLDWVEQDIAAQHSRGNMAPNSALPPILRTGQSGMCVGVGEVESANRSLSVV